MAISLMVVCNACQVNCLIITPYQATSRREPHKLADGTHTEIHKVVLFRIITRSSADTGVETPFSWGKKNLIALIFFTPFAWSWCGTEGMKKKTPDVSSPAGQGCEKLQFPSVLPAPWNAGIVRVTAGSQSTLKCNWTLERQTEKGRHCQGQSLAWHAVATSGLIDLYKATPPPPPRCHSVSLI